MTKTALVRAFTKKFGLKRDDAEFWIEAVLDTITEAVSTSGELAIPRFGTFKIVTRKAKRYRHPKTGEIMEMKEKRIMKFNASPYLFSKREYVDENGENIDFEEYEDEYE